LPKPSTATNNASPTTNRANRKTELMDIKAAERAVEIAETLKRIERKIDVLRDSKNMLTFGYTTLGRHEYERNGSPLSLTDEGIKVVKEAVLDDLARQKAKLVEVLQKLGITLAT
jgi:hypothetical protein